MDEKTFRSGVHPDGTPVEHPVQEAAPSELATCEWCGTQFHAFESGGRRKRFCSNGCRARFHYALRQWGQRAYEAGLVPIQALRRMAPPEGHYERR